MSDFADVLGLPLRFDVAYYDQTEAEKFKNNGHAALFDPIIDKGLSTDFGAFFVNTLFREQSGRQGFRTRDELRAKVSRRIGMFLDYFDPAEGSLAAIEAAADMPKEMTEAAGVGCSILALDQALGTHEADWRRIRVGQTKSLDFEVGVSSHGLRVVLEAKGSVTRDVNKKTPSISQHKRSIHEKKVYTEGKEEKSDTVFVGAIASIPSLENQRGRVWLVDPPPPVLEVPPEKLRILNRLKFYRDLIQTLGNPHVLIPLSNRIRVLEQLSEHTELDGVPLTNQQGKPYGVPSSLGFLDRQRRFGGIIFESFRVPIFVGMDLAAVELVVNQKFQEIMNWKSRFAGARRMTILETHKPDPEEPEQTYWPTERYFRCVVGKSGLVIGVEG